MLLSHENNPAGDRDSPGCDAPPPSSSARPFPSVVTLQDSTNHHMPNGYHKSPAISVPATTINAEARLSSPNNPSDTSTTPPKTSSSASSSAGITKWYSECVLPNLYQFSVLKETLHWARSEFQEMEILDLDPFGQSLVLDKRIQSASVRLLSALPSLRPRKKIY